MASYSLGRFILIPRGSYSSSANYKKLDVVLYQGSSYVCKLDCTNKVPTNTTYWQLLAEAGQATMTEEQKQEIISGILAEGVVVDPNYNTFTSEEKQKLAGLSNANNGTLAINYNGGRIGTFTADQSTNTTVNFPSPNDGGIVLVRQDDPRVVIGKFSVNQREDMTIQIPCGGSGSTPNNGTLTIQHGGSTLGTFTADQSANTTVTIPNNALTLQKNGTTVGTYTPATAATINITVPTSVADLSDYASYPTLRGYTSNNDNTTEDVLDELCSIAKLNSNYVYYCSNAKSLEVTDYNYDTTDELHSLTQPVTYIYVEAIDDFTVDLTNLPNYRQINDGNGLNMQTGKNYLITVLGDTFRVDELV